MRALARQSELQQPLRANNNIQNILNFDYLR